MQVVLFICFQSKLDAFNCELLNPFDKMELIIEPNNGKQKVGKQRV